MTDQNDSFPWELPIDNETSSEDGISCQEYYADEEVSGHPEEPAFSIAEIARLLNSMIMDIQHLELEVVRARYKLSFYLSPPYDEYLRMEIFSSLGARYGGDPVYDEYLVYSGLSRDDDAIDTPFHVQRMLRLRDGYDDYPDYYP